ncbi:YceH family protein [Tautonia sociabilis]|uniref:DUF480 domain-containing protein n=1 Tax=Tautonia sociabilis TaxID=2080755 RepID=A0A432MNM6_9BACT|nr:DUF480 domain-containing protein [Tautonia sociabilis]RUL88787.1 DUF480 domain-containing protein [Tautonia sociabilis]
MSDANPHRQWSPLSARERRVLGVLVEKQKTTPDAYPMSVTALVTGCNQKSNRDPVSSYDAVDIEDTLLGLQRKGAAILVSGSGRVEKWRHNLYEWLDLKNQPVAMAVLAELLLRGSQTVGELRGRAARMVQDGTGPNALRDLDELMEVLHSLADRDLVVFLSPPGQKRGVVVTHGLYPPEELERERQKAAHAQAAGIEEPRPCVSGPSREPADAGISDELAELRAEIKTLRSALDTLRDEFQRLKDALGA